MGRRTDDVMYSAAAAAAALSCFDVVLFQPVERRRVPKQSRTLAALQKTEKTEPDPPTYDFSVCTARPCVSSLVCLSIENTTKLDTCSFSTT